MSNIFLWIVFGGLAGWIATLVVRNDASFGIAGNVIVGILGAFLGGWIADKLSIGRHPGTARPTNLASFITALLGSIALLVLLNIIF